MVSTSHSASLAASVAASTIEPTTSPARASSRLRASSTTWQRSATTLPALPPSISPTLAVVASSMRPSAIAATAFAAAAIALRPTSGRIPAWAAAPRNWSSSR